MVQNNTVLSGKGEIYRNPQRIPCRTFAFPTPRLPPPAAGARRGTALGAAAAAAELRAGGHERGAGQWGEGEPRGGGGAGVFAGGLEGPYVWGCGLID